MGQSAHGGGVVPEEHHGAVPRVESHRESQIQSWEEHHALRRVSVQLLKGGLQTKL